MLAIRTKTLEDIRAVGAIRVATVQAVKLVCSLAMIVAGDASVATTALTIPIDVPNDSGICFATLEGHGQFTHGG